MRVVIIDCGAGNLHSVRKALAAVLPSNGTLEVTTDAAALRDATHVVLPGVGAFGDCMRGLHALPGMRDALETRVRGQGTPFLGICVGMQMLFARGHEHGTHAGLGWFEGEVRRIEPADTSLKIPHMGWNRLQVAHAHPFLAGTAPDDHVYFVHSYAAEGAPAEHVLATTDYGSKITAVIGRDRIVGTQFHPEKSQRVGLRLLSNFLSM